MPALCGYIRRRPDALSAGEALDRMAAGDVAGGWQTEGSYVSEDGSIAVQSWQFGTTSPISTSSTGGRNSSGHADSARHPTARLALDGYVLNRSAMAQAAEVDAAHLTDADLLCALWDRHGAAAMADVEGDFNFLHVEGATVHLVSSRLGARHLYWYASDDFVAFATRMSSISCLPGFRAQPDRLAMMEMFNFGYVGGGRSLLTGISLLPGASCISITQDTIQQERYWHLEYANDDETIPFDDLVAEAIDAYHESVEDHLRRFPDATIPLSGGLDSRTLLAFAARERRQIPVHHCSWYEGEANIARELADLCGARWHEYDPLHFDYATMLRDGGRIAEGNIHSHQYWFLPMIQRLAEETPVDVVMDGYLMDVLFGDTFLVLPPKAGVGLAQTRQIINGLWRRTRPDLVQKVFSPAFYDEYDAANRTSIDEQLQTIDEPVLSNRIQAFSFQNRSNRYSVALPNVQRQYADYAYPGTSRRLIDLYRRIPPSYKAGARFARTILSRAEPAVAAVNWAKTGRPVTQDKSRLDHLLERLPLRQAGAMLLLRATAGHLDLSHRGDLNRHFRRHVGFRDAFMDIAQDERTFSRGMIDRAGLDRLTGMIDRGWPVLFLLQALVTVEMFHRRFVDEA
ncbi:MAG: hypothetical protein HN712_12310 [Gemmatimonadetes bacterium]|jgi:asparagine synthetase B (glutamine-hydrolysing)|nr:hypothetical protein [Gemmatimonadota bacterium]MBT7861094.1 hypothetical protein [Gemmatimonadota bacterium]